MHTLGDFQVTLHRTMADLDLPPVSDALIEQTIGKGSKHLIRTLLAHQINRPELKDVGQACPALSVDALFGRAWQRYQHHYVDINGQFADVYPDALDALEALAAQGMPMACLTNKPLGFATPLLKEKSLTHIFGPVFGGDSFVRKKPDPLLLTKTCEALGTSAARTLMVGIPATMRRQPTLRAARWCRSRTVTTPVSACKTRLRPPGWTRWPTCQSACTPSSNDVRPRRMYFL